jgi:DNA polymerase-3 subunit alpha
MGKKQKAVLDKMKGQFMAGAIANGHPANKLEKIWTDWEAFAAYAFNKSHSTCYAFVAFQTAYLKAHYPAEYMAAVMTHNQSNIDKITFFMEECKRMEVAVKGPDVNESDVFFTVNKKGDIRFALSAIKGVGEAAVESIIEERKANGPFATYLDFIRRCNLRTVNKKVMESLAYAGAFDSFEELTRAHFFAPSDKYDSYIEHVIKYGGAHQESEKSTAVSLFGGMAESIAIPEPVIPKIQPWNLIEKLSKEKEVIGIFLSGHPLDDYKMEVTSFTTCSLDSLENFKGQKVKIAGFVINADHRISAKGTGWGRFTIQDYKSSLEIVLFNEDYQKFKHLFEAGSALFLSGNYEKRWNAEEFQFRPTEIKQLASIGDSMTESILLRIYLDNLRDVTIAGLDALCNLHVGRHTLKITFIDKVNRLTLSTIAKERKVNASNEFIVGLERLGIDYKLNV